MHNIIANLVKNRFSSVIIAVLILLWSPVLALADQSSLAYPPTKQYLNITLPSESVSPIPLFSPRERILVRVAYVNGLRDAQVLKQNDSGLWEPVGTTGQALTGNDGTFLSDAFMTSDGKIWVLAYYTFPSNSDLGGMFLLYYFDNEKWILTTPLEKEPARRHHFLDWDSGLHFFDTNQPFHIFYDTTAGFQFHRISQGKWEAVSSQSTIQNFISKCFTTNVCKRANDSWVIWTDTDKEQTSLRALKINGPDRDDLVGPVTLDSWNHEVLIVTTSVSPNDGVFALLYDRKKNSTFGRQYAKGRQNEYDSKQLPLPSTRRVEIEDLRFSPEGDQYAAWRLDRRKQQEIQLAKFKDGKWGAVSKMVQPKSEGLIFGSKIFCPPNSAPVIVWEDFFPL